MRPNKAAMAAWLVVIEYRLHISAFAPDDQQRLRTAEAVAPSIKRGMVFFFIEDPEPYTPEQRAALIDLIKARMGIIDN
jgi:hypothetical protein